MRPLTCEIRLHYLRENYQYLKGVHGNKLLAVVKANAYGHGAVQCARALEDIADGFAVAFLEEAEELRHHGIRKPIVLLEGVFQAAELAKVDALDLWTVVHNQTQLDDVLQYHWQKPTTIWLKMDSGMHRAGFFPSHYAAAYQALAQCPSVRNIVKMSHFACADEAEPDMTEMQLETFDLATQNLLGETSIANSAAMLAYPKTHRDWGRAGLALYGVNPFSGSLNPALKPVMRLSSKVFAERILPAHEPIGYGASFYTEHATRVGLVACGYADGYPRRAASNTPIAVNGQRTRLIGRISMDMMTLDLTSLHDNIGAEVELFGDIININEIADVAGTIPYEILCNIKRAQRVYVHQ